MYLVQYKYTGKLECEKFPSLYHKEWRTYQKKETQEEAENFLEGSKENGFLSVGNRKRDWKSKIIEK